MFEFAELINLAVASTGAAEIDLLFKVVDKESKGYLTIKDMQHAFDHSEEVFMSKVFI